MSRRRRPRPDKGHAFTMMERINAQETLWGLYKRRLLHVIAPDYEIPNLEGLYKSAYPQSVWDLVDQAENALQFSTWPRSTDDVTLTMAINLKVQREGILPNPKKIGAGTPYLSEGLLGYCAAAEQSYNDWKRIASLVSRLDTTMSREAIYHFWPCSELLVPKSGREKVRVKDTVPAELIPILRETSTEVMKHFLLPDLPEENNPKGSIEVRLMLRDQQIWPVTS